MQLPLMKAVVEDDLGRFGHVSLPPPRLAHPEAQLRLSMLGINIVQLHGPHALAYSLQSYRKMDGRTIGKGVCMAGDPRLRIGHVIRVRDGKHRVGDLTCSGEFLYHRGVGQRKRSEH